MGATALDAAKEGEAVGRILVARRQITAADLETARTDVLMRGGRLATALLAREWIGLDALGLVLAEVHGLDPVVSGDFSAIPREALETVPPRVAIRHLAVPLRRVADGLEVAFVEAGEVAVAAVAEASKLRVRARVAPEPLVYYALREHYGLARVPPPLVSLVGSIVAGTLVGGAGPVPEPPDEYVTTPMGGAVPHMPDEVTTAALRSAGDDVVLSPEDILLGAGSDDPAGRALTGVVAARSLDEACDALLAWCGIVFDAAAILVRSNDEYRVRGGAGKLAAANGISLGDASRSILGAALAGESGFRGPVPDTPANALLLESIGREPAEVLLFPLSREPRAERIVWADSGARPIEGAAADRLRAIAGRIAERASSSRGFR